MKGAVTVKKKSAIVQKAAAALPALMSLLFVSCSGETSGEKFLNQDEMESTHLEMELTEGVVIDASITPAGMYRNGLNAYYASMMYQEEEPVPGETFMAEPSVYGYSPEELAQLLAEYGGFVPEYTWEMRSSPGILTGYLTMQDRAGVERTLLCEWSADGVGRVNPDICSLVYCCEWDAFDSNAAGIFLKKTPSGDSSELDFASSGELKAEAETLLKTLTKEDYYPEAICVSMSEANLQWMKEHEGYEGEGESPYLKEDYYGYLFYRDIDGFPLRNLQLGLELQENAVIDGELNIQLYEGYLNSIMPNSQFVSWGRDSGLRCLSMERKPHITGLYKEQEEVCNINRILESVKQYFDSILVPGTVNVNCIEIAYSGWFSDAEDGPLRNILSPFWTVRYWDPVSESQHVLIYDAFSGLFIAELGYTP